MKKELAETVLELDSSMDLTCQAREEALSELQKQDSELALSGKRAHQKSREATIGIIVGFHDSGGPLVDFPSNPFSEYLPAHSIVTLSKSEIGREVVLLFEEGDLQKPIVMGLIQHQNPADSHSEDNVGDEKPSPVAVEIDGDRLIFVAEKEIVLRCGQASITLTRAGKILIRGTYLLNRSSGVNRIKGGSVQIN
jgi:hypothetical protein